MGQKTMRKDGYVLKSRGKYVQESTPGVFEMRDRPDEILNKDVVPVLDMMDRYHSGCEVIWVEITRIEMSISSDPRERNKYVRSDSR